jgi:DNA-binding SARP family transcriptional activator/ABC-type transport system substrate-binding protein
MEFRLLGPLEIRRDGRTLAVGGAKQRTLVVLLLLHANEVVSRDLLIDELWGDRASRDSAHSLDVQISRLRKTLDPAPLVTRSTGYVLDVDPEQIDVFQFERLLEEGRVANAAGDPAEALRLLSRALSLWRGPALADVVYESFARVEIERLEDLRLAATEERVEAELALGRHDAVISEVESLAAKHPLRERLRRQQMLALYRSGRQAEALSVYAETRRRLSEELGLEPSQTLRELEHAILRQDPSLDFVNARLEPRRRSGRLVAAIALAAAAGAAALGVLLAHGGTPSSRAQSLAERNSVALISEASARLVGQSGAQAPLISRFGLGSLWNVSFAGVLNKIDPSSARILGFVNAVPLPCGLAVGAEAVWLTDCTSPHLIRIDPQQVIRTGRYTLPVPREQPYQASQTQSVTFGAGSVWVGQGTDNPSHVYRVDPATGKIEKSIVIPEGGAEALAFGDGVVWVAGGVIGRLSKIDPRANAVTTPARDFGKWMCCVAAGGGYVWTAVGGTLWKLSEDGQVVSSKKLPATIADLRYADGAVWVSVADVGTVVRVDASSDVAKTYRVGHEVYGVDERDGILAVSVQSTAKDVTAGLKGRVVYVALSSDTLDSNTSTDPVGVQSWNADQSAFHYATCAKLYNYPDAAGAAGRQLVPEVAAGWPKVSDGGHTYTFTIRRGFGFSPPSHEQVTAESFRHEIERFLKQPGPWSLQTLRDVVGAQAFAAGRAAHVSGVTANGDLLVIRLRRPSGDFPTRLARPSFCAVPADLATIPYGLPGPIPTAGPYYLADRSRDVLVLKPNPNYHGQRAQKLDAIVYRTGVETGTSAIQIARGRVDYVRERDPALAPNTLVARSSKSRYRLTANNSTDGLALNTGRPLFADVRLRRAVESALDRSVLAHALDAGAFELPTARLLPPNLGGPQAGGGSRLHRDLRTARKLMAGRHVDAVFATYAPATGSVYEPGFVEALRSQLAAIGITVHVTLLRQGSSPTLLASVLAHADIARVATSSGDVDDVVGYLSRLPFLPTAARRQLDRIEALPYPRRDAAAEKLAAGLQRAAIYLGYADAATPELLSKRVGCVIDQPTYAGVDLAALCVRERR